MPGREGHAVEKDTPKAKIMNRRDLFLAAAVLILAAAAYLVLKLTAGEAGNYARITVDGEVYGTYSLLEEQTISVSTDAGENVLCIADGEIWMEEADCPDGLCINQGKISGSNETIVCLPHKLVVSIEGEDADETEDGFDAVAE